MSSHLSTTGRIVAVFIFFYVVATLALGVTIYLVGDHALREQLDDRLRAEAADLTDVYKHRGSVRLRESVIRRDNRGLNDLGYLLVDPGGRPLAGNLVVDRLAPGWRDIPFLDAEDRLTPGRVLTVELPDHSRMSVAVELAPTDALRTTAIGLLMLGFGAMLLGGVIGGILLIKAVRSRLNVMNGTAQAIIAGDMSQRVPASNHDDEFDQLARTLNLMLDRNSALIKNLRQVSSDIAHDLRTPLAHLRQRLERITIAADDRPLLRQEAEKAVEEADGALALFGAILRIAEVESGTLRRYFTTVDLSAAVRQIADSYMAVAEDSGRSLDSAVEDGIMVVGDKDLLSQALVNLLENAIRHTPEGAHIYVALNRESPRRTILQVIDDGHGVPERYWPELTRRFTRLDRARSGSGFGLGLNLVQAVMTVHEGTLSFADAGPGLEVTAILPATKA